MAPHPMITPPPTLRLPSIPRQAASFDLSSYYAELSSELADYSSLLAGLTYSEYDYSSFFAQYTSIDYNSYYSSLLADITATGQPTRAGASAKATATGAASLAEPNGTGSKGGLSNGAKIGIGVAVPVVVLLLAGLGIFLWCMGKKKGKSKATTIVAPMATTPAPTPAQPYYGNAQNQGYQQGYQQPPQFSQTPPPQFQQVPPQYQPPQHPDSNAALGGYAKGPPQGVMELETEYHFARGGAVEIGDSTEPIAEEKQPGWLGKKLGRKPVPGS